MIYPSTASKRHFPIIAKASGKYCWMADGKKLLDFTGSNNTVILGHQRYGLKFSPNFPGVSVLEDKVIKELRKRTGFKYYRFFKNGTDAVSCAIRLARYILCKDALIGYHGYAGSHNEYVYTFNPCGIPKQNSIKKNNNHWNCIPEIIVHESRYDNNIKVYTNNKLVTICDHLKSGINGLYENIEADFHCYGKSIANGYPISILTGRNNYMKRINEIYYSTTYGGDNVGLEAVLNTFEKYDRNKWLNLYNYAKYILPKWNSLNGNQIKILWKKHSILCNGFWQIMTCHTKQDINKLKKALDDVI